MPNATCPPLSLLTSPDSFALIMHTLGSIELPIHLFCGFMIVFKTPTVMKSMKYPLLYYHFWCSSLDILVTLLMTPYVLLPELAGFSLGILRDLGVTASSQFFIYAVTYVLVAVSLIGIYENRFLVIVDPPEFWRKYLRYLFITTNHLIAITYFLPVHSSIPYQPIAQKALLQRMPCLEGFSDILVLAIDDNLMALIDVPLVSFLIIQMILYLVFTIRTLVLETRRISHKTSMLRRKFFISVMIQSAVPLLALLGPLLWNLLTMITRVHVQALNNLAFLLIGSHGLVSTISILTVYEAYRKEILRMLGIKQTEEAIVSVNSISK